MSTKKIALGMTRNAFDRVEDIIDIENWPDYQDWFDFGSDEYYRVCLQADSERRGNYVVAVIKERWKRRLLTDFEVLAINEILRYLPDSLVRRTLWKLYNPWDIRGFWGDRDNVRYTWESPPFRELVTIIGGHRWDSRLRAGLIRPVAPVTVKGISEAAEMLGIHEGDAAFNQLCLNMFALGKLEFHTELYPRP